jgi:Transcriptional regulator containing PAS, AAA-type ATPase, and DNA-binding domains
MVAQMSQLNSSPDFLMLIPQPSTGLKDVLTLFTQHAFYISNSRIIVVILNPQIFQAEDLLLPTLKCDPYVFELERRWQSSSRWTALPGGTSRDWLNATAISKQVPYRLAYSGSSPTTLIKDSDQYSIFNSIPLTWLPLVDVHALLGWIGLEVDNSNMSSGQMLGLLDGLVSRSVLVLNRLLLRDQAMRDGFNINLIGRSRRFLELERSLKQIAHFSQRPVLICGERGSGKELAAYAIHYFSKRRAGPFIPVLASAFPESLQTDELFGHEKHAFTGAAGTRRGKFLAANEGTIFLDEIGDLSPALQVSLLRVIEQGEIQPIGRDLPKRVNVRVIAASNKDLPKLVAEGCFRADLYDRLNAISLVVPPLRERKEDIPLLAKFFLTKQCLETNKYMRLYKKNDCFCCNNQEVACATRPLWQALQKYHWPGNIRELENLIIKLSTFASEEVLDIRHLPQQILGTSPTGDRISPVEDLTLNIIIRRHIEKILFLTGNNQTQAAKILGMSRTTLQSKMRKLNIDCTGQD